MHYLLLHDIARATNEIRDARGDFGVDSRTLEARLRRLRAEFDAVRVDPPHWYAAQPGAAGAATRLASASQVVRSALRRATPAERRALAMSYAGGFSMPSEAMHFSTSVPERPRDEERMRFELAGLILLYTTISLRAASLLGLVAHASPLAATERATAEVPMPDIPRPETGDFVVVTLDHQNAFIGEVLEVRDVDVGTFGVRVRFLDERPYPDIGEDELPSDRVTIYRPVREMMTALVAHAPGLGDLSETDRHEACREAIVEIWRRVGREFYLRSLTINSRGEAVPRAT